MRYEDTYYSGSSALTIELSDNGIFFNIANVNKTNNKVKTFDWKQKKIFLVSRAELGHIREAIKAYWDNGEEGYTNYCLKLFKNPKYRNVLFTHPNEKNPNILNMVGLKLDANKNLSIGWYKNKRENGKLQLIDQAVYVIQTIDIVRITDWMTAITNISNVTYQKVIKRSED